MVYLWIGNRAEGRDGCALREHQTVDEIHQELLKRLEPLGVKIARREILYLFEDYCTLLSASSEAKDDVELLAQVE